MPSEVDPSIDFEAAITAANATGGGAVLLRYFEAAITAANLCFVERERHRLFEAAITAAP